MPHLADRPVLVVGQRLDDQRGAARTVRLVVDLFVGHARQLAGAALDGALDVVGRHVDRFRLRHHRTEPRITVDVAPAGASRHRQLLDDAREDLPPLGVGRALLVLDGVPLGMAGHRRSPDLLRKNRSNACPCYHETRWAGRPAPGKFHQQPPSSPVGFSRPPLMGFRASPAVRARPGRARRADLAGR